MIADCRLPIEDWFAIQIGNRKSPIANSPEAT